MVMSGVAVGLCVTGLFLLLGAVAKLAASCAPSNSSIAPPADVAVHSYSAQELKECKHAMAYLIVRGWDRISIEKERDGYRVKAKRLIDPVGGACDQFSICVVVNTLSESELNTWFAPMQSWKPQITSMSDLDIQLHNEAEQPWDTIPFEADMFPDVG